MQSGWRFIQVLVKVTVNIAKQNVLTEILNEYSPKVIFNLDETGLIFRYYSNKTWV